jgi:hypothetical protein
VLLYLDNFSGHKTEQHLENIEIKFLPANTTSLSQPLDQGVIKNLKFHYRRFLLRDRIAKLERNQDIEINLLEALRMVKNAWASVTEETIRNCFRHAGFSQEVCFLIDFKGGV